jgi:PAS domain S-box-containing protein
LLRSAVPIFNELQKQYGVSHLYFLTPDRVVFARAHRPDFFGDTIPRATTAEAERAQQPTIGLELGRSRGLLTLRVVVPWHRNNELLGYIELGEQINSFAEAMKRTLDVEVFVLVNKALLNRAGWEEGTRVFNRTANWDQYPNEVLVEQTMDAPPQLRDHVEQSDQHPISLLDMSVRPRRFFGASQPLMDFSNKQVGELIFLRDFTQLVQETRRTFFLSALLAIIVGVIFTLLLYDRTRHHFITPLLELRSVAERAGQGELVPVPATERGDELGDLARSLNSMILDLRTAQAEQTRLVLDAALDAVVTFDMNGDVIDWNRQAEALFGWSRADAIGRSVFQLVGAGGTRGVLERALDEYRDAGASTLFNRLIEEKATRRDGGSIPVELAIAPVRLSTGLFFSAFVRDISDRKRLEEDLHAAQRLEAIGKLAGGIAHDFNNLITAIVGYISSVQEALIPGSPAYEDTLEIRRAADRATGLVQQLLAFARKRVVQPRIVDINELVRSIDRMLRRLIGENIQLETTLDRGIWPVRADPGQLEQVLVNLTVNARDAMPTGGRIDIQSANVVIAAPPLGETSIPPGYYVMIAVTDNGVGMDEATLTHIFEPFFTTKKAGQGTGLGLATCYGIVKQASGFIRATSTPGIGSTFRIYLPRAEASAENAAPALAGKPSNTGNETILLVEDEYQVRRLIERALRQQGYNLITATNGAEAIETSKQYSSEIHLLLTDVVMPEVGGREAAAQIRTQRPDIRVIYMSGYSEELVRLQGELTESAAFIAKPFAPDELRRVVRDVLDAVGVA